jgi:hypothetical protein
MLLDDFELVVSERARGLQHVVGYADLAQIVQAAGEPKLFDDLQRQAELDRNQLGDCDDLRAVRGRSIPRVDEPHEALGGSEKRQPIRLAP